MNRWIIILSFFVCAVGSYAVTNELQTEIQPMTPPAEAPSDLAQKIIDKLKIAPDLLKMDDLPRADTEPEVLTNYETAVLSPSENVRDGFTHVVIVDPATRRFWVIRSGGFAGVHEIRGPAIFTEDGQIEIPR